MTSPVVRLSTYGEMLPTNSAEKALDRLIKHGLTMPPWPIPHDHVDGTYMAALAEHDRDLRTWGKRNRILEAEYQMAIVDDRRNAWIRENGCGPAAEALWRHKLIHDEDLDVLLPLAQREYLYVSWLELWWLRLWKRVRNFFGGRNQ